MTGSSSDAVTAREAMIIQHIEYYFGDFNLSRDNFLKEKIQEDDGWVTIDTMLNFNSLKNITDEAQMLCEALKKSSSGLMEVSEKGDKIRRSPSKPLPRKTRKRRKKIPITEHFPLDVSLLMNFFEGYPQVVRMWSFFFQNNISSIKRHNQMETFKRCVFETFSNKEDASEQREKIRRRPSKPLPGDTKKRIIKQIECCFSDVNLLCDKFLKDKIQEDDGLVTTDTMLNVNRLKKITDDAQMICKALRKSSSGLMEISEQGNKMRRSPSEPLPGDTKKRLEEIIARTVYVKPFPLDAKLDDLLKFFENYGQLNNVFMEKDLQKKTFNGSVFVTFANKADAAKFVNEEETKFKEQALEVKYFHTDYFNHKAAREETKGKKEREGKQHKKDEDKTKEEETEAGLEERVSQKMTKNAVLHLSGLNSETSIAQVKAFFSNVFQSDVAWVDIVKGATECYIRLRGPDSAGSTLEKTKTANNGKVIIRGSEIEVRVVEGADELQHWKKMFKDIADKKKIGCTSRRQGVRHQRVWRNLTDGRRNRGGPQGKRKHNKKEDSSDGEEQDKEEPPGKVIKSDMIITGPHGESKQNIKDASSDGEEQDKEEPPAKVNKSELVIKFQEVLNFKVASCDGEEQDTEEPPAKLAKYEMVITGPQGKRNQNKKNASSDGEEKDTEEPPTKVIKSELVIKIQEMLKINDASCGGEEEDAEEPPAKATKSEMIITGPQGKRKQNKKNASSNGEEQDTEEPPSAKVIKSEMIIMFEEVLKFKNASSDAEEEDTEEPKARAIKSDMIIKFKEVMTLENALSDGEEKNTEEPLAKVVKTEEVNTSPQGRRKQNKRHASSDGEEQDTEEPPAKVIKSEMIITRSQSKRKQNKKHVSRDGGEDDSEDPAAKITKFEIIMTRSQCKENKQTNKQTEDKAFFE